jgi:hypothetical protein
MQNIEVDPVPPAQQKGQPKNVDSLYDLFGVVHHLGGMFGGHYIAFAQCEDLSNANGGSPSPLSSEQSATFARRDELQSIVTEMQENHCNREMKEMLSSVLFDASEVQLNDYLSKVNTPLSQINAQQLEHPHLSHLAEVYRENELRAINALHRWYKFDDDFATELAAQHAPLESVIVNESAYLLFYKKKNISRDSLLRYT